MVPAGLQRAVYATAGQRNDTVDETWAPWWRVQARAIAAVAHQEEPNEERRDAWVARADKFAAELVSRAENPNAP